MRAIRVSVPADEAELAADRLWVAGARAIEERDVSERVELITQLSADDAVSLERLGDLPPAWQVSFAELPDAPAQTWREFATPVAVSDRLIISPAWLADGPLAPGVTRIAIEPGGSFGLGDHPTTRLSAAAVDRLVQPGQRVLDVGCGSGVLAILAALRGAAVIEAIDHAEAAREATHANAQLNAVADRVSVTTTPVAEVTGAFDLVVANILAPVLIEMSADLRRLTASSGRLVISGVLDDCYDHVVAALAPMRVDRRDVLDGWAAIELRHP